MVAPPTRPGGRGVAGPPAAGARGGRRGGGEASKCALRGDISRWKRLAAGIVEVRGITERRTLSCVAAAFQSASKSSRIAAADSGEVISISIRPNFRKAAASLGICKGVRV